jgi:hypothetical protein
MDESRLLKRLLNNKLEGYRQDGKVNSDEDRTSQKA